MSLIDFEKKLQDYLQEKLADFEYKEDMTGEELDDIIDGKTSEWMNTTMEWLGGKTPITYFSDFDEQALVKMFIEYLAKNGAAPDGLLLAMDEKKDINKLLVYALEQFALANIEENEKIICGILSYVSETAEELPYDKFFNILCKYKFEDDFFNMLAEEMKNAGENYRKAVIEEYYNTDILFKKLCYIDILAEYGPNEEVYDIISNAFIMYEENRAFLAMCLCKMEDPEAIGILKEAISSSEISFYDFSAIRDAIEYLGGDVEVEREFDGDIDFEILRNSEENYDK